MEGSRTELRQFLLYTGPVVLKNELPVHSLLHLVEEVRRLGPLDSYSSFPFEIFLQFLKNLIRQGNRVLVQVIKRLKELEYINSINPKLKTDQQIDTFISLNKSHNNGPVFHLVTSNARQFSAAKFYPWILSLAPKNSCVILKNDAIVCIFNFVFDDGIGYIIGKRFLNIAIFDVRHNTDNNVDNYSNSWAVENLSTEFEKWPFSLIKCKAYKIPVPDENSKFVIFPLLMEDKFR